jgi:hypothetical protein
VNINYAEVIRPERSGKYRYVISDVAQQREELKPSHDSHQCSGGASQGRTLVG